MDYNVEKNSSIGMLDSTVTRSFSETSYFDSIHFTNAIAALAEHASIVNPLYSV
jgi:pterin-4a-carbinolamine dehydratase